MFLIIGTLYRRESNSCMAGHGQTRRIELFLTDRLDTPVASACEGLWTV